MTVSYVQVGACPKCGAPIYAPSTWMSIQPPPSYPTCHCAGGPPEYYTTHNTDTAGQPLKWSIKKSPHYTICGEESIGESIRRTVEDVTAAQIEAALLPLLCDAPLSVQQCEYILDALFPALGMKRASRGDG